MSARPNDPMPEQRSTEAGPDQQSSGWAAGDALLPPEQQNDYRRRWDKIQIDFVDEPRASVRAADELVGEVTDRITSTFADARSRLEQRWQEGQEPSTEELRMTLRQYRDFFDRLVTR